MGKNVFEMVTEQIVERMKQGEIPWVRPYTVRGPKLAISHISKEPYSLLNQFLLAEPGEYFTFNQAVKEGFRIKKGSKAKFIVFWKMLTPKEAMKVGEFVEDTDDKQPNRLIPYLKRYNVFHESDIEGFERDPKSEEQAVIDEAKNSEQVLQAEDIISGYVETARGPKLSISDTIPSYSPTLDVISCPQKCQFNSLSEYYKSLFHEMVHSTGHKDRLNREMKPSFYLDSYSREELVAEIGSSYLASISQLPDLSVDNAAAYIQGWIKPLQNNPKWIVWASSRAEAAVNFILNRKFESKDSE